MNEARLTYEEATRRIREEMARVAPELREEGQTKLFEHGRATEKVFVFIHGLSNCPEQFAELGQLLFERGHNVFIPRLPYHGEKDPMTESFAKLTSAQMIAHANEAADLGLGLGRNVILAGLSISGTTAAWLAQNRGDLAKVALFAPFFGPAPIPCFAMGLLEWALMTFPNGFIWWDWKLKERARLLRGKGYCYPRFPSRVVGETMKMGREIIKQANNIAPRCDDILIVTTACDQASKRALTLHLGEKWERTKPGVVERFEFPPEERVQHDFIDPHQPDQRVAVVYPKMIELLEE